MSIDTLAQTLKKLVAYFFKFQADERNFGTSIWISGHLWHDHTNIIILPDEKLFTHRMLYIHTVRYYWRKIYRREIYPVYHFFYSYQSKILLRINFIRISILLSPYDLQNTILEFNIRVRNIEEMWRGWSKLNHTVHLN